MPVIDNAIYRDGIRIDSPESLDVTATRLKALGGMAWIGLYRPTSEELHLLANEFGLHHLAVEDAFIGHQRSKLVRYDDTLFAVLRPARFVEQDDTIEFGELHVFIGPDFVITVRHAENPNLSRVRHKLEKHRDLLKGGPEGVLYAILDELVDTYDPVIAGLETAIDEIEDDLFADGDSEDLTRKIYELTRQVITFQRAVDPLKVMLIQLLRGADKYKVDAQLQHYLHDVLENAARVADRADAFKSLLENALQAHSAVVTGRMTEISVEQNEQVKKITGWAAILFAPTLVAGVYGMNFQNMPELHWAWGYPFAIGLMIVFAATLYIVFRVKKWL